MNQYCGPHAPSIPERPIDLEQPAYVLVDGRWVDLAEVISRYAPGGSGTGASFSANKNGVTQFVTDQNGVPVKLTAPTVTFDIGNYYDASTSRWTPPAGVYRLTTATLAAGGGANTTYSAYIYKNGAIVATNYANQYATAATTSLSSHVTALVEANGADYFEAWFAATTTSYNITGAKHFTYFCGNRVG